MRFTMKRTLALVLALMLAMPTFVLADGEAMTQDANGQITANELVLNDSPALDDGLLPDDDLLLDGDLVLDGLSTELTQPEDPSGDLELGSQDPAEGRAGEQPDASGAGAPGEPSLELGDDAQVIGEELPDPQPLMDLLAERGLCPTVICESAGTQTVDAETMSRLYADGKK